MVGELLNSVSLREMHGGLNECQQILRTMIHLVREYLCVFFGPLALGNILEAVHGADDVSSAIPEGIDVNKRNAAHTIRPLNVNFLLAHRNTGAQHIGHGALMMREQTAVGAVHSIRSAKSFIGIAKRRRPAP